METKKENVTQTSQNTQTQKPIPHNHINCKCHPQYQDYINFKNDKRGPMRQKFCGKMVLVPAIIIKIFSSYVLYIMYYCKDLRNEIDINYSRFAITIFAILLYISYSLCILTFPEQKNVNKYTTLNKEKCNKREIIKLNQNFIMCEFCNKVKFSRTSHCRVCKSCISLRDHHCIFINNCVGFKNIQYFVSFLFWGSYAIIFDMYAYLSFTYLHLSRKVRIISFIDFCGNVFFQLNILGVFFHSILRIYNNRTLIESNKSKYVEYKCPIYDFYKRSNKFKANNPYNIGFLNHFYYFIGPSLLHFFLPLYKFKKYTLDENCQIFSPAKNPDAIQMLKYFWKDNENYYNDNILKPSDPDEYLKICHQYYDAYNII